MAITAHNINQKPGYKQTEVGVIPEDWDVKKFEGIGECIIGLTYKPSNVKSDGLLVLRSSNIASNELIFTDNVFVNIKVADKLIVRKDDILICVRNGSRSLIGKCALVDDKAKGMTFGAFMSVFRTEYAHFIFYQFQSNLIKNQIHEHIGATINQITNKSLNSFQIPFPKKKQERDAIATALSDVDALITSLDKLIAKKRDIKQATMQQLLTGKTRLPGFSGEWKIKMLHEVASISRGASPRPIEDPKWFNEFSSVGWVRISDVTKSAKYLFNTTQYLSEQGVKQSRFVKKEDLIMSICATIGKPIIVKLDVCIHDGFVIFERPKVNTEYLYYYLALIENSWSKNGQTGSQMNLNTTIIENENISFPNNSEEQQAIATVLSDMDAEIAALEQKREKTRMLKQGMMQELLTGKTRLL